ncbi:hypothetical protein ACFOJ6_20430 [Gordonia humi]|uniref:hypothetical protein n=1 Tax=Gordonia humi TaxID=686429 RepID=UPI003607367F
MRSRCRRRSPGRRRPIRASPRSRRRTHPPRSAPSATLDDAVKPGVPQPVAEGSFGYIATPSATKWMHDRHPEDVIANLPVGHHSDNQMMAQLLGGQLDAAVAQRGACVQIIVGGPRDGGLFTYGFYAVEPEYCPPLTCGRGIGSLQCAGD